MAIKKQMAVGQKRVPKNPIGKRKNRPKPVVPGWVFFLTHSQILHVFPQIEPLALAEAWHPLWNGGPEMA